MSDRPWLIAVVFVAIVLVSLPIIARNNKKKLAQYEQHRRDWAQTAGWTYHGDGTRVLDLLAHPDNQAIQVTTVNNWLIVQDSEFPARPADKLLETLQQVHAIIGRL